MSGSADDLGRWWHAELEMLASPHRRRGSVGRYTALADVDGGRDDLDDVFHEDEFSTLEVGGNHVRGDRDVVAAGLVPPAVSAPVNDHFPMRATPRRVSHVPCDINFACLLVLPDGQLDALKLGDLNHERA